MQERSKMKEMRRRGRMNEEDGDDYDEVGGNECLVVVVN